MNLYLLTLLESVGFSDNWHAQFYLVVNIFPEHSGGKSLKRINVAKNTTWKKFLLYKINCKVYIMFLIV